MENQFSRTGPLTAIWKAPAELSFFDGHFPGNPILPGAIALEVSLAFLGAVTEVPLRPPFSIMNAKFSRAIVPNSPVRLEAKKLERGWEIRWVEESSESELVVLSLTGS